MQGQAAPVHGQDGASSASSDTIYLPFTCLMAWMLPALRTPQHLGPLHQTRGGGLFSACPSDPRGPPSQAPMAYMHCLQVHTHNTHNPAHRSSSHSSPQLSATAGSCSHTEPAFCPLAKSLHPSGWTKADPFWQHCGFQGHKRPKGFSSKPWDGAGGNQT